MRKVTKAITYRITASILAQIASFALFGSVEINGIVLLMDMIQLCWYYCFEKLEPEIDFFIEFLKFENKIPFLKLKDPVFEFPNITEDDLL